MELKLNKKSGILIVILVSFVSVIWIHNVPKRITAQDLIFLEQIVPVNVQAADALSFDEQIEAIRTLHRNFFDTIQFGPPIPDNQPREPENLFKAGKGSCFDNSRTLEKALIHMGFRTRHVAVYAKHDRNFFQTFFTQHPYSHATTEVKTQKGWMIVDSNYPWLGKDKNGEIYNMRTLMREIRNGNVPEWEKPLTGSNMHWFYEEPVYYVYGLYSRHGRFFPPYNFIPDYNLRELLYNLPL